jgi:uncharacterized protein (DUF488 family)
MVAGLLRNDVSMIDAIYTIGYEGVETPAVLAALTGADVRLLLDVRAAPHSRKPGFSRRELARALDEAGIRYRHEAELGAPRTLRDKVRADRDYDAFFDQYARLLEEREELVRDLVNSMDGAVALMCYERDPGICHRSMVADRMAFLAGLEPRHLDARANPAS